MDTAEYDRPDDFNGPSKRVDIRPKIAYKVLKTAKLQKIKKINESQTPMRAQENVTQFINFQSLQRNLGS